MKLTDEQIQSARMANLVAYLRSKGFNLSRVGHKWYSWKDHESMHIYNNDINEEGKWYHHSRGKGGDTIAFLREYMDMSFSEAVVELTGVKNVPVYEPPKPKHSAGFHIEKHREDHAVMDYMCDYRKLDSSLIRELLESGSLIEEAKTFNAVFLYFDDNGKPIGGEKVGTSVKYKFKRTAYGSDGNWGFEYKIGKENAACFFESAIDLLSYVQMYRSRISNCIFISMMGLKPKVIENVMHKYHIPEDRICICSDNDEAGNTFFYRFRSMHPHVTRLMCDDIYKDWNDQLREITRSKEEAEKSKRAFGTRLARPQNF